MNRPDDMAGKPVRSREARALLAVTVAGSMMLSALAVVTTSRAAFNDTTANGSNTITSGNVSLSDDDGDALMFNVGSATPGSLGTRCINVTYDGNLAAKVRLRGAVTNTGTPGTDSIAPYVDVDIDVSTGAVGGNTFDCTNFDEAGKVDLFDTTRPVANGTTAGTLDVFRTNHATFTNGLQGWEVAANGEEKSYRIAMTLRDDDAAQDKNAQVTFTWESENN